MKRLTLILTAVCLSVAGVLLLRNPVAADAPSSPPEVASIDRLNGLRDAIAATAGVQDLTTLIVLRRDIEREG